MLNINNFKAISKQILADKKITTVLLAIFWLFFCGNYKAFAETFDPESVFFTQMKTIKTWTAHKYHFDNELMENIQNQISINVLQNPAVSTSYIPTRNDKGVAIEFGDNVQAIEDVELKFLQFVHEVSMRKSPTTLEIAAGVGYVSWKVPLAFEKNGTHYVNDLSHTMMAEEFEHAIQQRSKILQKDLNYFIKKIPGDCLKVLDIPELKNKFDAIYVANLEQFFNPTQHQHFLTLIENLLAPGGQAFLCSNSYDNQRRYPTMNYEQIQKGLLDMYPYFIQNIIEIKFDSRGRVERQIVYPATKPADDTRMGHKVVEKYTDETVPGHANIYKHALYSCPTNAFSPEIYHNLVATHPNIRLVDAFFVDSAGIRMETIDDTTARVAAIIKKPLKQGDLSLYPLQNFGEDLTL